MTFSQSDVQTVDDLMTGDLVVLQSTDSVGKAEEFLHQSGFHALPILDRSEPIGVVTLADCYGRDKATAVADIVPRLPVTIDCRASVGEAASVMRQEYIHHLLVTEEQAGSTTLIGIVSTFDLLAAIAAS